MFRGKVCSPAKNVHPHSISCGSVASGNQVQGAGERTRGPFQVDIPGHSYHYYHTSQVKTQLTSTNIQKYYNIHCWLDNVLKNANSAELESDFESDCQDEAEPDSLLVGDDYTCSAHLDQRYTPHGASIRSKSTTTDQKEALSRQEEKIKTLKTLITKHGKSTHKGRLKRKKLEPVRNIHCSLKAFKEQDAGLAHGNVDHQNDFAGNYSNGKNITGLGISAKE